ncbi:MAG: hypothetical protein IJ242_15950, partial [Clostridia bacterium]|nr:hypothetical protein [Clostridia bacterium]
KEGETERAWRIPLRSDLKWEDGTEIHAADFAYSVEKMLDPTAQNHRANIFYMGNLVIENAEAYLKQGLKSTTSFGVVKTSEGFDSMDEVLAKFADEKGYINWANSYGDTYDFATESWTGTAADEVVETPLTVPELYKFFTEGAGAEYATWADAAQKIEWANDELFINYMQFPDAMTFDHVGFIATGEDEITLILAKKLSGFYLYYGLSDGFIVNRDLYEKCASEREGVYSNTYGTSMDTTMSWGPYRLANFQSDKVYELDRNENWFGFNMETNQDKYETDRMVINYVQEPSTRVEMFLNGKLDVVGLDRDRIDEYATSDYTYYSEGDSVYAMVFNPDMEALKTAQENAGEHINKTIITVKEFRMAMSLAMNRAEFCLAVSPTNQPAFALYGSQIVSDPERGIFYRTTDVAKQVVVKFWGLDDEIGDGKLYANVDDAIDSITGYNLEMARAYFDKAYDIAIEKGLMKADDTILIMVGTPNATSVFYNNGYDFIVNNYTEAVKGTKLEGKLTFSRDATLGNSFSDALRTNRVDMLFGVGWTGSTFDPYGLIEAYVTSEYQYDPSWNPAKTDMTIELEGETYTADVFTWYKSITNNKIQAENAAGEMVELDVSSNAQDRVYVLSVLENTILQNYDFIPLMGASSAHLKGMKVEYFLEDEVFPMGRGGIKYMTYNYDDDEWDAFVAEQGGTLNYK